MTIASRSRISCARKPWLLLAGAILMATSPVLANEADTMITVTAIAVRDAEADAARVQLARIPGGASVTEASEFSDRLAINFRDTLAFAPGVFAQVRYGEEMRLSIRGSGIRQGFHLRGITLLQDGVPITLADGGADFQELDPAQFRRIEDYRRANRCECRTRPASAWARSRSRRGCS